MGIDYSDEQWMLLALEQAEKARLLDEVPVGAVLVDQNNELIAVSHNQPISSHDPTSHAEINVLRKAAQQIQNYRLINTTLYVTLEPCVMCVGAMLHGRIKRLVYGADEYKTGAIKSQFQLLKEPNHNHSIEISSGILAQPCGQIMSDFFKLKRTNLK